jgi:hypothetical protein
METCVECGYPCTAGEYHPYEYCVLVKAGQDPKRFVREVRAELLEALKRIEVIGRGARPKISKGAIAGDIARAAIAKAEGKE